MTINIFGREIVFEIKEKSRKESSIILSNKKFINRFIWSVLVFFAFGIIIEFSKLGANYTVGSVAPSDIIAYKDVTYTVDILDKGIKEKIMKNTTPEYDKISSVPEEAVVAINNFFRDIKTVDLSNDQSISNFIRDNRYNLTVKDFKGIVERESVGYVVNLITIIKEIYEVGIVKTEDFDHIIDKNNIKIDDLDKKFLKNFIKPNLKINDKKTMEKIEDNLDSLKDKEIKIYKGDIIVKKGDVIDVDDYEKLEKLNLVRGQDKVRKVAGLIITFVLVSALFYYLTKKYSKKVIESKAFYPSLLIIIMVNILYVLFFNNEFYIYLLPFATIPIILTILGDKVFALTYTFFNMILLSRDETWFLVIVAVTLVAIYRADKLTNRSDIVKLGVFTGMFQGIMSLSYGLISQLAFPILIIMIIFSVFSGILTGMIALGILPYLENSFDILTDIKLLELSDFSHTLLKQLLVTAPGTFHHSIMVGALAEAGAEAIGANATFARVASYYHDIGKMKRPLFFVENQKGGKNPHNTIKPSLSALIITSHTRDGYIIGKQNKLPKEILDIILEHHGTTLVQFFYYKALEKGEEVLESDFRYSGPKPKTKESSIIFLADTIEAAVRASEDKSREGIENLIRYLIRYKIDDNQLSNSNLTLGEIEKVIRAFLNVLQGAYHERIKYPKLDENSEKRVK
jgi:metal dependent phosphohydrolase